MNAVTPFLEANQHAVPFSLGRTMAMGFNIGRDILNRANEFKNAETAIGEYVINGYEAYNIGQVPQVEVTVDTGKDGSVIIADGGKGMDRFELARFWTMHSETVRREGGLNRRGYFGTGKVAFLAIADQIRVETVRNGLLNVTTLARTAVRRAADTCGPVDINLVTVDEPTDRASGTRVVITKLKRKLTAEDVRNLRDKISLDLLLTMTGANVSVNGVKVEPQEVKGEEFLVESECGNFTARIVYNELGHHEDLRYTFFHCDNVFVGREQTGKEAHRFAHKVYARIDATAEWSNENFHKNREVFISESRDGRLKTHDAAPRAMHAFAEKAVRAFMKKLDDEDAARRQEEKSEKAKELLSRFSRMFSPLCQLTAGPKPRVKSDETKDNVVEIKVEREARASKPRNSANPRGDSGKLKFDFRAYNEVEPQYVFEDSEMTIYFNTNNTFLKSLSQAEDNPARTQALFDIAATAVASIETREAMKEKFADIALQEPALVIAAMAEHYAKSLSRIKNELADNYAAFHIVAQAA